MNTNVTNLIEIVFKKEVIYDLIWVIFEHYSITINNKKSLFLED